MFVFVGAVEELIFRSILQTRLEKALGLRYGLLLTSALFGIMHSVYGVQERFCLLAFLGLFWGIYSRRQEVSLLSL